MTRKPTTVCAALACPAALDAAPAMAAPAPVVQRFQIALAGQVSPVKASGLVLNSVCLATPVGPTTFAMSFPSWSGSLSESVGGLGPGCVDIRRPEPRRCSQLSR